MYFQRQNTKIKILVGINLKVKLNLVRKFVKVLNSFLMKQMVIIIILNLNT